MAPKKISEGATLSRVKLSLYFTVQFAVECVSSLLRNSHCASESPNSNGSTTACATLNSSAVFAVRNKPRAHSS